MDEINVILHGPKDKKPSRKKSQKTEFSKTLLKQESALIWVMTVAFIVLAFVCVFRGYVGSLPWLAAMVSFPWAAYGVSQVWYYKKSTIENSKDGIKYETVLKELDQAAEKYKCNSTTQYYQQTNGSIPTTNGGIDPFGPI